MEPALKQWFLHIGGQHEGPLSEGEIKSRLARKQVSQENYAWCEGMSDWKKLSELDAFRAARPPAAPTPAPVRPPSQPSSHSSEDLSALIEVPHRQDEPTVFLESKAINKIKREVRLTEIRPAEDRPKRLFWKVVLAAALLLGVFLLLSKSSHADDSERLNVETLKHKYWAQGEEDELRVVQNRRYSKSDSMELSLLGGFVSSDPFLTVHALGGSLGYYLSENLELGLLGWKYYSGNSSAMNTLQQTLSTTANTNPPQYFLGADLKWSPLYGKLSLLGEKIIYYDIYLLGGAGETHTLSGTDPTPFLGIGSQIYLSRRMMLQLTYFEMLYNETVLNATTGAVAETRLSWTGAVMLGLNFLVF